MKTILKIVAVLVLCTGYSCVLGASDIPDMSAQIMLVAWMVVCCDLCIQIFNEGSFHSQCIDSTHAFNLTEGLNSKGPDKDPTKVVVKAICEDVIEEEVIEMPKFISSTPSISNVSNITNATNDYLAYSNLVNEDMEDLMPSIINRDVIHYDRPRFLNRDIYEQKEKVEKILIASKEDASAEIMRVMVVHYNRFAKYELEIMSIKLLSGNIEDYVDVVYGILVQKGLISKDLRKSIEYQLYEDKLVS